MQIRTAVAIGTGIAVGMVLGIGVSEKTKENLILHVKKKLIFALTGEKWEPRKTPTYHTVNYASYSMPKKETNSDEKAEYKEQWDVNTVVDEIESQNLLDFDSEKEAWDFLKRMKRVAEDYKYVSVWDVAAIRGKAVDYTLAHYGWDEDDIFCADVEDNSIVLCAPIYFPYEPKKKETEKE